MAKKMAMKMAKKPSRKRPKKIVSTQDKNQLKRAALFYWSHSIYIAAEKAAQAVGGFEKAKGAGDQFYCVVQKMKEFIRQLNRVADTGLCWDEQAQLVARAKSAKARSAKLRVAGPATAAAAGHDCALDEDCPDGQICLYGNCESPFA